MYSLAVLNKTIVVSDITPGTFCLFYVYVLSYLHFMFSDLASYNIL